jgi:acyl dehydratase
MAGLRYLPMSLYLEDLTPGMVFTSATQELDEAAIKRFAGEFDPQPFHLDNAAAEKTIFGGLAASGWHTASVSMRLLVDSLPLANGIIGAGVELAWPKPVRPGDVLQVVTEVLEVTASRTKPDRGMGVVRSETRNQHGEVVQIFTSRLVLFRRPV